MNILLLASILLLPNTKSTDEIYTAREVIEKSLAELRGTDIQLEMKSGQFISINIGGPNPDREIRIYPAEVGENQSQNSLYIRLNNSTIERFEELGIPDVKNHLKNCKIGVRGKIKAMNIIGRGQFRFLDVTTIDDIISITK